MTSTSSTAPAVRVLVGVLRPKVISSQATSCWRRKLRWRPTSVARWPWRTNISCKQADEIRFSITELVIDFIAPDGRAGKSTGEGRIEVRTLVAITMVALNGNIAGLHTQSLASSSIACWGFNDRNVRSWHVPGLFACPLNGRYRGKSGRRVETPF